MGKHRFTHIQSRVLGKGEIGNAAGEPLMQGRFAVGRTLTADAGKGSAGQPITTSGCALMPTATRPSQGSGIASLTCVFQLAVFPIGLSPENTLNQLALQARAGRPAANEVI